MKYLVAIFFMISPAIAQEKLTVDEEYVITKSNFCLNGFHVDCFAAAARCSVLSSSAVCDRLGLMTAEKRKAPNSYYLQGKQ